MAVRERRLSSDLCPLPPPLSLLSANPGLSLIDTSGEGAADRFPPSPSIDENLLHNRIDIRAKFNPLATRPACDCSLGRFDTDGKRFWPRSCGSSRNYPRISIRLRIGLVGTNRVSWAQRAREDMFRQYVGPRLDGDWRVLKWDRCVKDAALELIRKIGCERLFAFDRLGRKLKGSFRAFVKEYLINLSKEMHYIEKRIRSFSRTILLDMLINSVTWWKMAHQDGIFVEDGISSHNSQRTFPIKLTLTNLRMSVLQPFPSLSLSPLPSFPCHYQPRSTRARKGAR